jgi:hypothetical protein
LNLQSVNDVRQTELHTAEPLVLEPNCYEVDITNEKLKRYKLPGIHQILAEIIQTGGSTLCSEIHKLTNFIWNNEELQQQCNGPINASIYKKSDTNKCNIYRRISMLPTT